MNEKVFWNRIKTLMKNKKANQETISKACGNYKRIICIFIILLFLNCNRQNEVISENGTYNEKIYSYYINEIEAYKKEMEENKVVELNCIMYIDSPGGRIIVYDAPFLKDNRDNRTSLYDLTKVIAVKEQGEKISIGGRDGKWTFIVSGDIEGWVFGGYLSLHEPQRILQQNPFSIETEFPFNNIDEITKFIFWDLNFFDRFLVNSLEEYLSKINLPKEYNIIKNEKLDIHDGNIIGYIVIMTDSHKFTVLVNEKDNNYSLREMEIIIDENNYKHLFPYDTIDEYKEDNNFGFITKNEENLIEYFVAYDVGGYGNPWVLEFKQGLLYSIRFAPYLIYN